MGLTHRPRMSAWKTNLPFYQFRPLPTIPGSQSGIHHPNKWNTSEYTFIAFRESNETVGTVTVI